MNNNIFSLPSSENIISATRLKKSKWLFTLNVSNIRIIILVLFKCKDFMSGFSKILNILDIKKLVKSNQIKIT